MAERYTLAVRGEDFRFGTQRWRTNLLSSMPDDEESSRRKEGGNIDKRGQQIHNCGAGMVSLNGTRKEALAGAKSIPAGGEGPIIAVENIKQNYTR